VFARVIGAVAAAGHADPVDPQQRAVEDDERLASGQCVGLLEGRCQRGQQLQGFARVAVGGGGADRESAGQIGIGFAFAQVGKGEQGLLPGFQAPPAGADRRAVVA
jgi:hypothetical protein